MQQLNFDSVERPLDITSFTPTPDLTHAETLPASWYTDPRMLTLEKERIFYKTWQPIGRVDLVRRPGDYFACEVVGPESSRCSGSVRPNILQNFCPNFGLMTWSYFPKSKWILMWC